ncbi:MAG TPA: DUF1501 domain-containing protein [Pirellulales bacterium]
MKPRTDGSATTAIGGGSRRDFLKTGAKAFGSLAIPALVPFAGMISPNSILAAADRAAAVGKKSVAFVNLLGGPSHLDMYDMKPAAPAEIRGEFRPINTNVPGIQVCEHLPMHAKIADKFAIVNGLETTDHHDVDIAQGAARGLRFELLVRADNLPFDPEQAHARLEFTQYKTVPLPHGDWDTHGRVLGRNLSIFAELRDKLPAYDRFLHDLIVDTYNRGLNDNLLIVACGEFGRTPWINQHGGRNHWSPCGSVLFAGGGLKMGQTIGNTGPIGEREQSRSEPYGAKNLMAMIYRHLDARLPTAMSAPIAELI